MGQSAVRHTADFDSRQAYITKYTNNIYITSEEEETSETRQTSQAMMHALLHRHCGLSHALCNSFFSSEKGVTVAMTDARTHIRTTVKQSATVTGLHELRVAYGDPNLIHSSRD